MATYKHLRSSTANKRPTTSITDGQLAINTNTASPGLFFKDSAGTGIVKVGPVHVGTTAPNATPAAGGSSGNYLGEQWLDTSVSPAQMKVWNGSAWVGIVADELPVSKLQDGDARQLLQTDAAGTGVEWTSNVDVPGTLDVTSTATFDSIARHPLGSAAAPTLTFTGDPNTGIYSPGADQVAVATNSTGRLFVNASGKVGVGEPNTQANLHVAANFSDATAIDWANSQFSVATPIPGNGTANRATIYFAPFGSDNNYGPSAISCTAGTSGASTLKFFVNSSGNLTGNLGLQERMRITSAGLVGIGTSSPTLKLSVDGDTWFGNGAGVEIGRLFNDSGVLHLRGSANVTGLALGTNNTRAVTIDSSQRVGIGTTAAPAKLTVSTSSFDPSTGFNDWSDGFFAVSPGGTSISGGVGIAYDTSANVGSIVAALPSNSWRPLKYIAADHRFEIDGSEKARLDSSGRLLVGTSSTSATCNALLQASGGTGGTLILARGTTSPANGEDLGFISFNDSSHVYNSTIIRAQRDGGTWTSGTSMPTRLTFSTTADGASSPTERMRLNSSGQLLVGTSSASRGALVVNGSILSGSGTTSVGGTATTLFTAPPRKMFLVSALYDASNIDAFSASAIILSDTSGCRIMQQTNGTQVTLSVSGFNVQATNAFSTSNLSWSYTILGDLS